MTDQPILNPLAHEGLNGPINTTITPMALNRHGKLLPECREPHRKATAVAIPLHEFETEVAPVLALVQRMRKIGSICTHTIEYHRGKRMLRRKCCNGLFDTDRPAEMLGLICPGCSRVILVEYLDGDELADVVADNDHADAKEIAAPSLEVSREDMAKLFWCDFNMKLLWLEIYRLRTALCAIHNSHSYEFKSAVEEAAAKQFFAIRKVVSDALACDEVPDVPEDLLTKE